MANTLEQQIIAILEQTRNEIRANMQAKNINASGRTSASLRVEMYTGGIRLVGGTNNTHKVPESPDIYASDTAPIPTLEVGREGGKVPRGLYYILRQWSKDKGISFPNESERNTFAYFLARKIAREGTRRHDTPVDVYTTPANNAKEKISNLLRDHVRTMFYSVSTLKGVLSS